MKVCLVSQEYPPETGGGGIGTYVYNLAHALTTIGCEVHVIARSLEKTEYSYKDGSVHMHRIPPRDLPAPRLRHLLFRIPKLRGIMYRYFTDTSRLEYSYAVYLKIRELIRTHGIEVVEAPEWAGEGFFYAIWRNPWHSPPLVVKLHTPLFLIEQHYNLPGQPDAEVVKWMEKTSVLKADRVTSPSASLREIVAREYGMISNKIRVIPYPLDLDFFSPSPSNPRGDRNMVLYVGRIEIRKGVHVLTDAIPHIVQQASDVRFVFVGRTMGTLKQELLEQLAQAGCLGNIEFCDQLDRPKLVNIYRQSSVCVVPSLYDNFPNTCLEAMACGKAVVASDSGGLSEIIEDGVSGRLVPPGDVTALANAILELLGNDALRQQLGIGARKRVERLCSPTAVARETLGLYQEVVRGGKWLRSKPST